MLAARLLAFAVKAFGALGLAWQEDTLGEEPPIPGPLPWLETVQPAMAAARPATHAALVPARRAPRDRSGSVSPVVSSPGWTLHCWR